MDINLKQGQIITKDELRQIFKCSDQGGMRRSKRTNTLVLISYQNRDVAYDDRSKGNLFLYTGMGTKGDQSLDFAQNKTLAESGSNGIEVFLFVVHEKGQHVFKGQVELAMEPFEEIQKDIEGNFRKVYVFPLKFMGKQVFIDEKEIKEIEIKKEKYAKSLDNDALKEKIKSNGNKPVRKRSVITESFDRNPFVAESAKRRANGRCQLCEQQAPFKDNNGDPFLHVHHIIWLAKGGADTEENTVALCPNCHAKMHVLDLKEDVDNLRLAASKEVS